MNEQHQSESGENRRKKDLTESLEEILRKEEESARERNNPYSGREVTGSVYGSEGQEQPEVNDNPEPAPPTGSAPPPVSQPESGTKENEKPESGKKKHYILIWILALVIFSGLGFGIYSYITTGSPIPALLQRFILPSPIPVIETSELVIETSEPVIETPEPVIETPEPVIETPEPVIETPEPVIETPEPVIETPELVTKTTPSTIPSSPPVLAPHVHEWVEATCTKPRTCEDCGATEGDPLGHNWAIATCTEPSTCTRCGITRGKAAGHSWAPATCTTPKTCRFCDSTEGEALGHKEVIDPAVEPTCTVPGLTEGRHCSVCGETLVEQETVLPYGHAWHEATCMEPSICTRCGETEGEPLGHDWVDATLSAPKTCIRCGETEGYPLNPVKGKLKVGAYVTLGSFEQDKNRDNGKEPIEWRVLDIKDGKALLISKEVLAKKKFEEKRDSATWDTSSLRTWLNETFYKDAFSENEQRIIVKVQITAEKNPKYSTYSGKNTEDKVFLLSITEADKYYTGSSSRLCSASTEAKGSAAEDNSCWWWLRTTGNSEKNAAVVNAKGDILNSGDSCHKADGGVRPAIWVNIIDS